MVILDPGTILFMQLARATVCKIMVGDNICQFPESRISLCKIAHNLCAVVMGVVDWTKATMYVVDDYISLPGKPPRL